MYDKTLKVVSHEGAKGPKLPPRQTNYHPGYVRNAVGGIYSA